MSGSNTFSTELLTFLLFLIRHILDALGSSSKTIICVNLISSSKLLEENLIPSIKTNGINVVFSSIVSKSTLISFSS